MGAAWERHAMCESALTLLRNVQTCCAAYLAPSSVVTGVLSPDVKLSGCEVDHLHPPSAAFKNEWSSSSPPIRLDGVHMDPTT